MQRSTYQPIHAEQTFKIIVVGDATVGKTSLIRRFANDTFSDAYKATVGVDFAFKAVPMKGRGIVKLQLWDIAGQERFQSMTRVFYQSALAAVIVCNASNVRLAAIERWKTDIDSKVFIASTGRPIPCILVANKLDLVPTQEERDRIEAQLQAFAVEQGFVGLQLTSAKAGVGVKEAFLRSVDAVFDAMQLAAAAADQQESPTTDYSDSSQSAAGGTMHGSPISRNSSSGRSGKTEMNGRVKLTVEDQHSAKKRSKGCC
jgi:small GTP-binding protein